MGVAVIAEKPIQDVVQEKAESIANHEETVKKAAAAVDESASKHVNTKTRQIEDEFDACIKDAKKALEAAKDAATLERETILKAGVEKNRLLDTMYTDSVAAISQKRKDAQDYLDSEYKVVESIRELLVQLEAKAPATKDHLEEEKPHSAYTSLNEPEHEEKPCETCVTG